MTVEKYEDPDKWPWEKYRNYLVWSRERDGSGLIDWEEIARIWYNKYHELTNEDAKWRDNFDKIRQFVNSVE
jgi:hypothetical protein